MFYDDRMRNVLMRRDWKCRMMKIVACAGGHDVKYSDM